MKSATVFRITFLYILMLGLPTYIFGQDPHFSQYFASPLTLNPANTGKFEGDVRAAANYRNQWPSINNAYTTFTAAVDLPIFTESIGDEDRFGVGFMGYSDKSAGGALSFNYFSFSTAFHKGLDENGYQQLGLGLQATYANQLINTSKLQFADQLTPYGFTNVTTENFNNGTLKNNYLDFNAGLLYTLSTNDDNNVYVGVSAYHLNKPRQSFTMGDFQVYQRYTFHAGGYFPVGEITTLHLSGLHSRQGQSNETVIGGALQFSLDEDAKAEGTPTNLFVGSWLRMKDALIPYIGLEYQSFKLGATYDINTSDLKTASQSRGGIEISLLYIFRNPNKGYTPCPKF